MGEFTMRRATRRLRAEWTALLLCCVAPMSAQQAPPEKGTEKPAPPAAEAAVDQRLVSVKRVCIQRMGEDALGVQVQEMVIARLFESRRFSLTENCDNADYAVKGTITERSDRVSRSESESIGFGERVAASDSSWTAGAGGRSNSASASVRGAASEHLASSDVKVQAAVTLRVVDKDGEILWATSQESTGGKTKGAIGDAAERAVRKLLRDIGRAEQAAAAAAKR